ncbi:MAG: hypothetical protein ACREJN_04345 [Nitrospiraceae bacterium]
MTIDIFDGASFYARRRSANVPGVFLRQRMSAVSGRDINLSKEMV